MKQLLVILLSAISINIMAQDPDFHIYLCFGQSNMEGSAEIQDIDKLPNTRFLTMASMDYDDDSRRMGQWYVATPPLSQQHSGLSPADGFGKAMVKELPDSVKVGVISVAIGGCDIRLFDKDIYQDYTSTYNEKWFLDKIVFYGGNPYARLVEMGRLAQKKGVIKGILLHQGETNTADPLWPEYVKKVYEDIKRDLGIDVPIFAGQVVHKEQKGVCAKMNPIIDKLPELIPDAYVISSKGCSVRSDNVHFDSAGVRELGRRYAKKVLEVVY